jgi:protein TonB
LAAAPPEADLAAAPAPPRVEPKPFPRPQTTARVVARLGPPARPPGARAAASAASPASPARGAAEIAAYRSALLAKIRGAARYPEAARERGATGVATVRFALDSVGALTLADLAQSSGDRELDDEALAAVRRASPLPSPPAGAPRAYSAPIRFDLR